MVNKYNDCSIRSKIKSKRGGVSWTECWYKNQISGRMSSPLYCVCVIIKVNVSQDLNNYLILLSILMNFYY